MLNILNFNRVLFFVFIGLSPNLFAECFSDYKQLLNALNSSEQAITPITKDFFIEEQFLDEFGNIKDRNRLDEIPEKYSYDGRLYPTISQQQSNNIEMKNRLSVAIDIRNVSEKVGDDYRSNYWFWQEKGCWYLKQKTVHLKYVEPEKTEEEGQPESVGEEAKTKES